jgi:hypothetical protein
MAETVFGTPPPPPPPATASRAPLASSNALAAPPPPLEYTLIELAPPVPTDTVSQGAVAVSLATIVKHAPAPPAKAPPFPCSPPPPATRIVALQVAPNEVGQTYEDPDARLSDATSSGRGGNVRVGDGEGDLVEIADNVPVTDRDGVRVSEGVAHRVPVGVGDFVELNVAEAVGEQEGCEARPVDRHTLHEHATGASEPRGQKNPMGQMMQEALKEK